MTMRELTPDSFAMLFPDPLTSVEMISGAVFLYFDEPLVVTPPAQVITKEAFKLLEIVGKRQPTWAMNFANLLANWRLQQDGFAETTRKLEPLIQLGALTPVWMIYPATRSALKDALSLAEITGVPHNGPIGYVNEQTAASELTRHILLEVFLELHEDIEELYRYCEEFFASPLEDNLVGGYFLRLNIIRRSSLGTRRILITNDALVQVLSRFPAEVQRGEDVAPELDVISWEFFRQILSPRLDPLDMQAVQLIAQLRETRMEEVARLRSRCMALAYDIRRPDGYDKLTADTANFIKAKVEREIADVLTLDRTALQTFFEDLFSDQKT